MVRGSADLPMGPLDHGVLFYDDAAELAAAVSDYLLEAIQAGGVAVVIATPEHRRSIEARLGRAGVDLARARAGGSYLALDAEQTLRRFMAGDWPSAAGFWQAISPVIRRAAQRGKPVHAFGEMVALLWEAGLANPAIELEAMWNELGAQYPFSLLCAYPASSVAGEEHADALAEVCHSHTAVAGTLPGAGHP